MYICYIIYICYGYFNVLFGQYSFIFISFTKIIVALDSSYINTYKTTPISSFYTVIAKDIAIIRMLVNGGGHLEFSHEKVDEKNRKPFF